jgi:hypothetical protein
MRFDNGETASSERSSKPFLRSSQDANARPETFTDMTLQESLPRELYTAGTATSTAVAETPASSSSTSTSTVVTRRTEKRGVCNMLTILPLTTTDDSNGQGRTAVDSRVYNEVSAWLAWYHVTTKYNPLLPHLQERLSSCAVNFRLRMRDDRFSVLNSARQFLDSLDGDFVPETILNNSTMDQDSALFDELQDLVQPISTLPTVLLGSARSAVSTVLSFLSAAYGIPQISSSSTAGYLDNKGTHPLFSRTVPTNKGDAQAMTAYYGRYLRASHVGILYIGDDYGTNFHADLVKEMVAANIQVFSVRFDDTTVESAIQQLVNSGMRYIVAILNPSTWRPLVREARRQGIMGSPDYVWLLSETMLELASSTFELDRANSTDLALALHGSGIISLTIPDNDPFDQMLADFGSNEELQQLYIKAHAEPEIFQNFTFASPGTLLYQYLTYDAAMALAIAVCEAPDGEEGEDPIVAGHRLYNQLIHTEFVGASGHVVFDNVTGTRRSENMIYRVQNLLLSDSLSTPEDFRFSYHVTALVNFTNLDKPVESFIPFVYATNGTMAPRPLPTLDIDMNLVPLGVRTFGLSLCATVILVSIGWMVWTLINRKKDVVRASQPIFLCQLCVGTIITASAIIPMSFQEPMSTRSLNMACMSVHWLISFGFVTSFSALFSKTWRLNKLFKHGRGMRRVIVRPHDVALPFGVLFTINLVVLIVWTIQSPVVWLREELENYDQYGRSVESVGTCHLPDDNGGRTYLWLSVVVNVAVLIFTIYQAYLARNLPTEFSESSYIAVAMASLLEVLMLGMPLLFLGSDEPSASFFIRSVLVFLACLSILLPVFLPKFIQRNVNQRFQESQLATNGSASTPRLRITIAGNGSTSGGMVSSNVNMNGTRASFSAGTGARRMHSINEGDSSELSQSSANVMTGTTRIRRNEEYFKERTSSSEKTGTVAPRS